MFESKDIVAQLPDQIIQILRLGGSFGKDFTFKKGYIAVIPDQHYFIHTRAMLPLKDTVKGVGFGLWVKVSKEDFDLYMRAEKDDELYRSFHVVGNLANTWPGFPGTYDDRVRVRVIQIDQKPYITQYLSEPTDIAMKMALLASSEDSDTKGRLREMAFSYLVEMQNCDDYSLDNASQKISE